MIQKCMLLFILTFACRESTSISIPEPIGPRTSAIQMNDYARILYVSVDTGSDEGDGSKEKPWHSIGHALARSDNAGRDARVAICAAQGIYIELTLHMKEHVDLYGGFEPLTWDRDIVNHQTILNAEKQRRVLVGCNDAKLDGFFVWKGQVRGRGAGLLCQGVSPCITNNVFFDHTTLMPDPWQPAVLHEVANDGAAIYCSDAANPLIMNNIFARNSTEVGRGAAIALQSRCNAHILNNVFIDNVTGLKDPMRSSDGAAVSVFDGCHPVIGNNVFLGNKALAKNDAGALFIALWSSATVRNNRFVGNACYDDAGALFVGGQEHRYGTPLDPMPPKDQFNVHITENVFIGNSNPSRNSGAMRFTMEARGQFSNNIVAHNSGLYFQRSEAIITQNTILDNLLCTESKAGLDAYRLCNNIIWSEFQLKADATVTYCNIKNGMPGEGNISSDPLFKENWQEYYVSSANHQTRLFTTELYVTGLNLRANEWMHRVIRAGDVWGIVRSNESNTITIWGDFTGQLKFALLPTFHLSEKSPCIDRGSAECASEKDIDGDVRGQGKGIDIGADEYYQPKFLK